VRRTAVLILGLAALTLLAGFGPRIVTSQTATPSLTIKGSGPEATTLVPGLELFFPNDTLTRLSMVRFTYAPGETADLVTSGAVIYFIDQGELGITFPDDHTLVLLPASYVVGQSVVWKSVRAGEETSLQAGQSIYAEDGQLGSTRNFGSGPLVVLALILTPNQGRVTSYIAGSAATPSP
jgi:hypothetical protein